MSAGRPTHVAVAGAPRGAERRPEISRDPAALEPFRSDAAHFPGGRAACVAFPRQEGEIAALLAEAPRLLPIGAQSSLTGGATPAGDWVVATSRMLGIEFSGSDRVRVGPGVPLLTLQKELARRDLFYPASTTFSGALLGGTVATNAAGPASFKYGSTRQWVRRLRVMLAGGDVLDLHRGEVRAHGDGYFEIRGRRGGPVRVPLPSYRMPAVRKRSAGYHCEPGMDLIDLFVGSEGTLGIITEIELQVLPIDFRLLTGFLGCRSEATALALAGDLRAESLRSRRSDRRDGLDVPSLEMIDRPCLDLLREEGKAGESGIRIDPGWEIALFFELELPGKAAAADPREEIGSWEPGGPVDTPLRRLCAILDRHRLLDHLQVAMPDETARAERIRSLREEVPIAVNHRIGAARQRTGEEIRKVAADMIVPFESVGDILDVYREGFRRRGLRCAIWGHLSDGNLHPNLLPETIEEVRSGEEAVLEFGRAVERAGGCPLSEHGVGRSPVKQELLRRLYGDSGIDEMRRLKRALDPRGVLAPGVLFPEEGRRG